MKSRHVAAALVIASSANAQTPAVVRTPVTDPRPLLIGAIASPSGEAHGVLTGEIAAAVSQKFKSTMPINIDVTTEKRYAQAGCSRLKVLFWQDSVVLPGATAPRKQTIEFGINYCRDGQPPRPLS